MGSINVGLLYSELMNLIILLLLPAKVCFNFALFTETFY